MTKEEFHAKIREHTYLVAGLVVLCFMVLGMGAYYLYAENKPAKPEDLPIEEQFRRQAAADKDFSMGMKEREQLYPWHSKLPLQKENYFVYFDFDKKEFIAKLYPQKKSSVSLVKQEVAYKAEIEKKLRALGADTATYHIEWVSIPE